MVLHFVEEVVFNAYMSIIVWSILYIHFSTQDVLLLMCVLM